jgi:hypothetical protein
MHGPLSQSADKAGFGRYVALPLSTPPEIGALGGVGFVGGGGGGSLAAEF